MYSKPSDIHKPASTRVVDIEEIRDIICEFVANNNLNSNNLGTLARLLRTYHRFFPSAARVLWKYVHLYYVVGLLPGAVLGKQRDLRRSKLVHLDIPDPLPARYFDRLGLYAPYIENIVSYGVQYTCTSQSGFHAIRSHAEGHTLLPKLVSITLGFDPKPTKCKIDLLPDWFDAIMSPSLQHLDVGCVDTNHKPINGVVLDRYCDLVSKSLKVCPNLTSLSLMFGAFAVSLSTATKKLYATRSTSLTSLACDCATLNSDLYHWLTGLANLEDLKLVSLEESLDFHPNDIEGPVLPRLSHLRLDYPNYRATTKLFKTSLVKNLTLLSITLKTEPTRVWGFFKQLVASCNNITELALDNLNHSVLSSLLDNLALLQSFSLRTLRIQSGYPGILSEPHPIRRLLELWPSLVTLDVPVYRLDHAGLRDVLPYTAQLSTLRANVDIKTPTEISDSAEITNHWIFPPDGYSPLKLIGINAPSHHLINLDVTARYLCSLRPHLVYRVINSFLAVTEPPIRYEGSWQEELDRLLEIHCKAMINSAETG